MVVLTSICSAPAGKAKLVKRKAAIEGFRALLVEMGPELTHETTLAKVGMVRTLDKVGTKTCSLHAKFCRGTSH